VNACSSFEDRWDPMYAIVHALGYVSTMYAVESRACTGAFPRRGSLQRCRPTRRGRARRRSQKRDTSTWYDGPNMDPCTYADDWYRTDERTEFWGLPVCANRGPWIVTRGTRREWASCGP